MSEQDSKPRRRGRRHRDSDEDDKKESEMSDEKQGSPKHRETTGWGDGPSTARAQPLDDDDDDEAPVPQRSRRRRGNDANNQSTRRNQHLDDDDAGTTDIMEIPDLEEEEHEEDITTQVAAAPRNTGRRIQSLQELNKKIQYSLPAAPATGIDLSLLTSALCPQMAVIEDDDVWDFDILLREVSQDLQQEMDEKAESIGVH